jgi:hypothetical protein
MSCMCFLCSCCMYCSCIRIPQRHRRTSVRLQSSCCRILFWVLELWMLAWESSRAAVWRIYAMVNCLCFFLIILSYHCTSETTGCSVCTKIVLASPACCVNQYKNLTNKVLKCCANVDSNSWFQTFAMFFYVMCFLLGDSPASVI